MSEVKIAIRSMMEPSGQKLKGKGRLSWCLKRRMNREIRFIFQ